MGSRVGGLGTAGLPADKALAGVPRLLDDLQRLSEDSDSADIVFILGRDEERVFAHRVILMASFQTAKRGEVCRIPGCSVSPAAPGTPTPVRLPQAPPDTFKQFLMYVYTGKILLQDSGVFEMMALAQELGVDELRNACEDHVTSTLSVPSACTFLQAQAQIEYFGILVSNCRKCRLQTFCLPARVKVKKRLLNLLKMAYKPQKVQKVMVQPINLIFRYLQNRSRVQVWLYENIHLRIEGHIVGFDEYMNLVLDDAEEYYLCLEEEDVWRAVLNWAKYQAGVTQPTAHWTEEERARVCQHLSYVINHVRLLLIDSQVFAEEVEPTGAVPMELSLERYRHAALPSKYPEAAEDQRLRPRISPHMFPGSLILGQDKSHYQRILNAWFGHAKQTWRLVYRASSHGYSASSFHRHCDGISPTYVIVLGARGEICGGFSDAAWGRPPGKNHYVLSERAFLFTLYNHQGLPPTQFHLKETFGDVLDQFLELVLIFLISSNCNSNMDSYSNLPHTYDGEGASPSILMGDYNFTVADYEVFTPLNTSSKLSKNERYQ
ncbi:hypothetical protein NQ314_015876 [Rhamnusium bicolor]|uniref:Sm protein E n=1 Tax=Rhamnusium bicolor TaxID=1586634 RepID=A0AAV8WXJ4_9CUCU|nr:hypothetical protein NQ314_015876 [Rhamnusium bicolor]